MNPGTILRDASRTIRTRPVLVIGAGVGALVAARLLGGGLGGGASADEPTATDPAAADAGIGSGTFGLGYGPGMGGTGLYASGGELGYGYSGDLPGPTTLPIYPAPPGTNPTPTPVPVVPPVAVPGRTAYLVATVPANAPYYSVVGGRARLMGRIAQRFTAEVRRVTAGAPSGSGSITLLKVVGGTNNGRYVWNALPGVTVTTRYR